LLSGRAYPFAGWEMPVHRRACPEHRAVRADCGLDVSHMGEFEIRPARHGALAATLSNDLDKIGPGQPSTPLDERPRRDHRRLIVYRLASSAIS
jgi:glycine cleavage system aminomethyltransferase T